MGSSLKSAEEMEHRPRNLIGVLETVRFAILLLSTQPWLTWKMLFKEIRRRLYSDELWFGLQFDLNGSSEAADEEAPLTIRELASGDVPALFDLRQTHSNESELREIVVRLLCIRARLRGCYVGTTKQNRPCCLCWLIPAACNDWLLRRGMLPLQRSEVLLENIWTHRDYRGNRFMMYLTLGLFEKAKQQGARRAIAYIREGNEPSLAGAKAIGWDVFVLRRVRHRMFRRHTTFAPTHPPLPLQGLGTVPAAQLQINGDESGVGRVARS
jgi:hypothetical protein